MEKFHNMVTRLAGSDSCYIKSLNEQLTAFGGGFASFKVTIESHITERLQQEQQVRVEEH